jgi:hypothetical protein
MEIRALRLLAQKLERRANKIEQAVRDARDALDRLDLLRADGHGVQKKSPVVVDYQPESRVVVYYQPGAGWRYQLVTASGDGALPSEPYPNQIQAAVAAGLRYEGVGIDVRDRMAPYAGPKPA